MLWEIKYLKKDSNIKYLHIFILLIAVFAIFSDRSRSEFFYPLIGKTYTITSDINYSYGNDYINWIEIYDVPYYHPMNLPKTMFLLKAEDTFTIKRQILKGHADFGTQYIFEIQSNRFNELYEYLESHRNEMETLYTQNNENSMYSKNEPIYVYDNHRVYIREYTLYDFFKSQRLKYSYNNSSRLENSYIFYGFYIFIYLFVTALFFLLLTYRNKKVFYEKR